MITFEDLYEISDRISKLEARLTLHEAHTTTNDDIKILQEKVEFLEHEIDRLMQIPPV
jgi:hypothetical protein